MIDEEAVSWDHMLLYIERGSHSHISWMCLSMGWLGYDTWISERMALTAGVLLPRGLGVLSRCSLRQLFLFGVVSAVVENDHLKLHALGVGDEGTSSLSAALIGTVSIKRASYDYLMSTNDGRRSFFFLSLVPDSIGAWFFVFLSSWGRRSCSFADCKLGFNTQKIVVSFRRSWIVVWSFELLCSIRRSWFIGGTIFTNLASHLPQQKIIGLLRRSWIVS